MTRIILISIFLTLFSQTAWVDEVLDKGDYTALINDTLDKNGADCRVDAYIVEENTSVAMIFSIKCTQDSYLKKIEVTCTKTPAEQCFVSRY